MQLFAKTITLLVTLLTWNEVWSLTKPEFFNSQKMYTVWIRNWHGNLDRLNQLRDYAEQPQAVVEIYEINPHTKSYCPDTDTQAKIIFRHDGRFKLRTSGNKTNGTAKSSYKIKIKSKTNEFLGMDTLNLKSMWNDPSMMREAIAWDLFKKAQVPAPRHTYAKFCVNNRYFGLYSIIEQVDTAFLKDFFPYKKGNLYKTNWKHHDLGAATLSYIAPKENAEPGSQYYKLKDVDERTYALKSKIRAKSFPYQDLAKLIEAANKKTPELPYQQAISSVFDVQAFLRWAAVNQLLGAWDNYIRTGGNFYLYNSSKGPGSPRFTWVPWDYDNILGISYQGDTDRKWQHLSVFDWELSHYKSAQRPLIKNILEVEDYRKQYVDSLSSLLENHFTLAKIENVTDALFHHIKTAVYQEANHASAPPYTGRQFTNDQFYQNARENKKLYHKSATIYGIKEWVKQRINFVSSEIKSL